MKTRVKHTTTEIAGFTLIELMIVVAIIGVLAMIAYPSYSKWTIESRRSDAVIALSQLSNDVEKFYSECGFYPANITGAARSCTAPADGTLGRTGALSPNNDYQLGIALAGGGYTLTATPAAGGRQVNDADCTQFRLSSTGAKTATGSAADRCWRK